ncbi:hypothetical protein [Nocardiopsis eucommiae]|uniref:hypothetical protein n=1 Tax=Nocardiopsis eucommiae TaxID=2831970 RepID=UPI003D707605
MTDTITLFSSGLLSKWGFGDGATPDEWMDYLEEHGLESEGLDFPLAALVRKHLLPELRKHHQINLVDIETSHNPIRAEYVDGIEIDWYADGQVTLNPEWVDVPLSEALKIARPTP